MDYRKAFIDRMREAVKWAKIRGAEFNEAVVFAQAALESNWGLSLLARAYNNLFGIKAGSWKGKTITLPTIEYVKGQPVPAQAKFRWYDSWQLCIVDYAEIIRTRWWYREALKYLDNADKFLDCLLSKPGKPGWATDPSYFTKVKNVGKVIERLGGPKWQA